MTAHPLELIAAMPDGLAQERAEEVGSHMAHCESCRAFARKIDRVDRLIGRREADLAVPDWRPVPRRDVGAGALLVIIAAGLTLLFAASVFRERLGESTAAPPPSRSTVAPPRSGVPVDACKVIVPAARAAGIGDPAGQAMFNMGDPTFFSRCAYGYDSGWQDPHLLVARVDAPQSASAESLLSRAFGAPDLVDRWRPTRSDIPEVVMWMADGLTEGRAERWSTVAVLADPYFFVVTAATAEDAMRLARAVVGELPPLHANDACIVLGRAATAAGLDPGGLAGHGVGIDRSIFGNSTWVNGCHYGSGVPGWTDAHLLLRLAPTSAEDAPNLLNRIFVQEPVGPQEQETVEPWTLVDPGVWLTHGRSSLPPFGTTTTWSAVAVLSGTRFFVVTHESEETALRIAREVVIELNRP